MRFKWPFCDNNSFPIGPNQQHGIYISDLIGRQPQVCSERRETLPDKGFLGVSYYEKIVPIWNPLYDQNGWIKIKHWWWIDVLTKTKWKYLTPLSFLRSNSAVTSTSIRWRSDRILHSCASKYWRGDAAPNDQTASTLQDNNTPQRGAPHAPYWGRWG